MRVTLSSADVVHYRESVAALLSPLDSPSVDAWRSSVTESIKKLTGAYKGVFMLPLAGHALVLSDSEDMAVSVKAYVEHYHRHDRGLQVRRKTLGLEVFSLEMLYDRSRLPGMTIYNEWMLPYEMYDPVGMGFEVDGGFGLASVHLYHQRSMTDGFGELGMTLMRLTLPAFKAGVLTLLRLERHRADLARMLDTLRLGIRLTNVAGRVMHQNPALNEMLAGDPASETLEAAIQRVSRDAASHAAPSRGTTHHGIGAQLVVQIETERARYRVRGCLAGEVLFDRSISVMVMVDKVPRELAQATHSQEWLGLTAREGKVASLIVRSASTAEMAASLGISCHTVRRHTEQIFRKLGVHSRAAVKASLWGTPGESLP
jgi:DNA-binding CsgD family transcriptional regulator